MNFKKIVAVALVFTALAVKASADNNYNWPAQDNDALYASMMAYLKSVQTNHAGEPLYFAAQNLYVEIEALHSSDPYAWLGQVQRFCDLQESIYPPSTEHPNVGLRDKYAKIRRDLTRLRDFPLHEITLDGDVYSATQEQKDAFTEANKTRLIFAKSKFLEFLRSPAPPEGELHVLKLYSSGVVLRTAHACIGIDIANISSYMYEAVGRRELADSLDALYVTHAHGDHYDTDLMMRVLTLGKPVVMPSEIVGGSFAGTKYIWTSGHPNPPVNIAGVAATQAYMSAQGTEPCLLYLIEMDGWRIIHVGDNSVHANEVFYEKYNMADVIFDPVFQEVRVLESHTLAAPNPNNIQQYYINIHENEYKHKVEGRVSYKYLWSSDVQLGSTSFAYSAVTILDCGEHIVFSK